VRTAVLDTARAGRAPSRASEAGSTSAAGREMEETFTSHRLDGKRRERIRAVTIPEAVQSASLRPRQNQNTSRASRTLREACPTISQTQSHHTTDREEQVARLPRMVAGVALVISEVEPIQVAVGHRPDLR
jgi:hypothetical protein